MPLAQNKDKAYETSLLETEKIYEVYVDVLTVLWWCHFKAPKMKDEGGGWLL